jgi:hypothetical protein
VVVVVVAAAAVVVVVGGGGGISYNISMEHCVEKFIVAQRSSKYPAFTEPKDPSAAQSTSHSVDFSLTSVKTDVKENPHNFKIPKFS